MNKLVGLLLFSCILFSQEVNRDSLLYSDTPLKDPSKALLLSSLAPGSGQIYNESYIKSGIIIIGFTYFLVDAIQYNSKINDLKDSNLKMTDFSKYKSKIDTYFDNRNVAIWRLLAIYTYNVLDAYIGAYLFGFDEIMDDGKTSSYVDYNNGAYRFNFTINF